MIEGPTIELVTLGSVYAVGGYVLGSIPVAWLLTWAITGRDLRTLGSGNVGVMNTALSVHRWAGLIVLLSEIAKGLLAVVVPWLATREPVAIGVCAMAAFVGTRWPVWLRFHGGRGNTCAASSLLLIAPLAIPVLAALWFGLRWLFGLGNFSATRVMVAALPPVVGLTTLSWWWFAVAVAYVLLFLTTHRPTTDDHMLINQQFPNFWAFVTAPPRKLIRPPIRPRK